MKMHRTSLDEGARRSDENGAALSSLRHEDCGGATRDETEDGGPVRKAIAEERRAYVLVNNRAEGNAPLTIQAFKENFRKFPVAFEILRRVYRFFIPVPVPVPENPIQTRVRELQTHIKKAFSDKAPIFFVQIGSNDGLKYDPLHPFIVNNKNWTGIFVEPVELMFHRLQQNYDFSKRFIFENVAIGSSRETRKFYYVSENAKELGDSVSSWYDQIGSLDKAHILKHCTGRNSRLEPYIVEQEVKCVRLQDILDKHRVKKIDLLHIDAEGFDYGVLSQIDFKKYKPSIVIYEHYHLSLDEKLKAESLLQTHGYTVTELEEDTLAHLRAARPQGCADVSSLSGHRRVAVAS